MIKLCTILVLVTLQTCLFANAISQPKTRPEQPHLSDQPESQQTVSLLSLRLTPRVESPNLEGNDTLEVGPGIQLGVEYRLRSWPTLYMSSDVSYGHHPVKAYFGQSASLSVSVFSAALGSGLRLDADPWLSLGAGLSVGYFGCFLDGTDIFGGNMLLSADARVLILRSPLRLVLGASYQRLFNFYAGLSISLGLCLELLPTSPRVEGELDDR